MPYRIRTDVTWPLDDDDDHDEHPSRSTADSRSIVCRWLSWTSMARGEFVLLHETGEDDQQQLEKVDVGPLQGLLPEEVFDADDEKSHELLSLHDTSCWTMSPGAAAHAPAWNLTANYQTRLVAGETYHLLWPGREVDAWDWLADDDEVEEEEHQRCRRSRRQKLPRLVLPPAGGIRFTAVEADEPFPDRQAYIQAEGPHTSYDTANWMEWQWRQEQKKLRDALVRPVPAPEPEGVVSPPDEEVELIGLPEHNLGLVGLG